ncbi:MAG: hypothetical protein KGY99_08270, partial [Phycisphaerae bacterium]|nr:hypothetical protein [Phycisphaerae bacterium]
DDRAAIQQALDDNDGDQRRTIYFPNGQYDIVDALPADAQAALFVNNNQRTNYLGESRDGVVFRVKDDHPDFQNAGDPVAVFGMANSAGFGFESTLKNMTFDVGAGNEGARGVTWFSNNGGTLANVKIVARERGGTRAGVSGLNIRNDNNGPSMIRDLEIVGFDKGIEDVYGLWQHTLEHIRVEDQNVVGYSKGSMTTSLRGFTSVNSVPAIQMGASSGVLVLIDSSLTGGDASNAAIEFDWGNLFVRNVDTEGYGQAISWPDGGQTLVTGPNVDEYSVRRLGANGGTLEEDPYITKWPSETQSLHLTKDGVIPEVPEVAWETNMANWDGPHNHGGVAGDSADDAAALQAAIDSGATTIYLPGTATWKIAQDVYIRGNVRRIISFSRTNVNAKFILVDQDVNANTVDPATLPDAVTMQHFWLFNNDYGIEHRSDRTLVLDGVYVTEARAGADGNGPMFTRDVSGSIRVSHGRDVWARGLNTENDEPNVGNINDGGQLWVFGFKTERGGVKIDTKNGGRTELLGGHVAETTTGNASPIFRGTDAAMSLVGFRTSSFMEDTFDVFVEDTRGGESRTVVRGDGGLGDGWATGDGRAVVAYFGHSGNNDTAVVNRHVFYNNSAWDGDDPGANGNDDDAIAPDKTALPPGEQASFANYTSYHRGINGVMIDIDDLADPAGLSAADFAFATGNDSEPADWGAAPAPASVTVRPGAGVDGSDRVTLIWADNDFDGIVDANEAVAKDWLEVTVQANATTGLLDADVFYFGNAVGETGDSTTDAFVNAVDGAGVREHPRSGRDPAPIDYAWDITRDRFVNAVDSAWVREHPTSGRNVLNLITPPVPEDGPLGVFETGEDVGNVGVTGSSSHDAGLYTLEGSGWDIWSDYDAFHYLHEDLSGDGEIVARVTGVENTNEWAKAGVMFRESTAPDAKFVMVLQRPDNQVTMQWRDATGASASWTGSLVGGTSSVKYVKLVRSGDSFTGYYSIDGSSWTTIATHTTDLGDTARVGLCVTSHNDATLATATFDTVSVTPSP